MFAYANLNPVNLVDPFGLKGGGLIPIRQVVKKNATTILLFGTVLTGLVCVRRKLKK